MWLFTVNKWYAYRTGYRLNSDLENVQENIECVFHRSATPTTGLELLKRYERAFEAVNAPNDGKGSIIAFRLLSMVEIPNIASSQA